ncbi:probable alpha-mannosidase [Phialocephala subalpina]|uniref:Alpha-mannosidase n=1 Tax=Phialocephala subalpina TaxID=576137 RepID=A0A1L7WE40_9HELO|nr:probable alpha-mannosidase [Phialocephala subalpina]
MCSHEVAAPSGQERTIATNVYPLRALGPVGKRITSIYKKRLANFFTPGQWEKANLLVALNDGVYSGPENIKLSVWHAPGTTRPTFKDATDKSNSYEDAHTGQSFGPSWTTHWFKAYLKVPEEMCEEETHIELHWDCDNEATVWSEKGDPLQGLTGRGERIEWILPDSFKDGKEHLLYIEMACNGMFGNGPGRPIFKNNAGGDSIQPPDPNKHFTLSKAELVAPNMQARMLHVDFEIIHDAALELPEDSWEQHEALNVATRIIDMFNVADKSSISRCRKIAEEFLGTEINSEKVYNSFIDKKPSVVAIGHCHIDTCWLWPWAETKRKVVRSWSNQCDLMDRYTELNFACSQAQQFKWLKEDYPYTWERVKSKVKAGQFHPVGGCWIEHDTNLPSGESLVRQFLYGQRFFESNFGFRSTTCWLPDSFGFSSQLPQLCRQAGMARFLTQKPCFNSVNDFPHTTFNWVALDGSQVICHIPPAKTYCAEASFGDIKRSISNHKSLDQDNTALIAFGKGDGGGGPTWRHLERLRRLRGMSNTVGQVPRVHSGATVEDFFDKLEEKANSLVTWHGELYFELHRGVYTTQAKTKANNRNSEFLLRDIELLATIASIQNSSYQYPKAELDEMWEGVLLCQFHDCLPGSAIKMCYDDSDQIYDNVYKIGFSLLQQIYPVLGLRYIGTDSNRSLQNLVALNTLPWPRQEIIELSENEAIIARGSGNLLSVEEVSTSRNEKLVTIHEVSHGVFQLQSSQLSLTVEDGYISSLYDRRAKREVLSGKANKFVIFDDKPMYWQAWDVEVYHLETRQELSASTTSILENKPYRVSVVTETKISDVSSIRSTITLSAAFDGDGQQSYVECAAEVDWHETMKFLKVEFPVNVRNTEASYETQFGIVKRPTHYNTSWDMAKFEVCCHKFVDLSEYKYGVSILNDSKYGFATVGNVMRLSLLRSPKAPDDTADMGLHRIRWAIMPHEGELGAQTVRAAFNFNNPLKLMSTSKESCLASFQIILKGDDNLVLDTVKRGEDDVGVSLGELPRRHAKSVIIRVYDSLGGRGRGTIGTTWPLSKIFKTNILEDDEEEIPFNDGKFEVDLGPFQVCTYRLVLA